MLTHESDGHDLLNRVSTESFTRTEKGVNKWTVTCNVLEEGFFFCSEIVVSLILDFKHDFMKKNSGEREIEKHTGPLLQLNTILFCMKK